MLVQEYPNLRLSTGSFAEFLDVMDHEVPQLSANAPPALDLRASAELFQSITPKPAAMQIPFFLSDPVTCEKGSFCGSQIQEMPASAKKDGEVSVDFCVEWTHKKGKRKPQQFWVYCEENQENYLRAFLRIDGESTWNTHSSVMQLKGNKHSLILVPNVVEASNEVSGLEIDLTRHVASGHTGHWGSFARTELVPVEASDVAVHLTLLADDESPMFPDQGQSDTVKVVDEGFTDVAPSEGKHQPFEFTYRYLFKNRSKGWFKIQASMTFQGLVVAQGTSDIFMFNNPRMVKKKELVPFESNEIKFMQCYALASQRIPAKDLPGVREEWATCPEAQAFAPERLEEMLEKSHLTLTQKRRKAGTSSKRRSTKPKAKSVLGKRSRAEAEQTIPSSPVSAKKRRLNDEGVEDETCEVPSSDLVDDQTDLMDVTGAPAATLSDSQFDSILDNIWESGLFRG